MAMDHGTAEQAAQMAQEAAAHDAGGFLTHSGFLADPQNWVLVSCVIFLYVLAKYAKDTIVGGLDARTERIRNELNEAERLRTEAQELLAQYQRKHRDAMKDAEEIIDHAKEAAKRLTDDAKADITESVKRREAALEEKIARAEANAMQEIRDRAAELAMTAAEKMIMDSLAAKDGHSKMIDESIEQMKGKFH